MKADTTFVPAKFPAKVGLRRTCLLVLLLAQSVNVCASGGRTITFPARDGLTITADLYMPHSKKAPFIVLYHRAGWSRGEYLQIAPDLNSLGYNCVAVDLRSGGAVNDVDNRTFREANDKGKRATYLDAYPDMIAALDYTREDLAEGPVIIWGSSYSASLALVLASEHPDQVDGVVAFSPGEYFDRLGKGDTFIETAARTVRVPVFMTSSRREKSMWSSMFGAVPSKAKTSYVPPRGGQHGSRALWAEYPENEGYWKSVSAFLAKYFPTG